MVRISLFVMITFALSLKPGSAHAQRVGGAAGVAFPLAELADTRDLGYRALGFVATNSGLIRLEAAATMFPGDDNPATSDWQRGSYRTYSLGAAIRPTIAATELTRVRAQLGFAAHRTTVPNVHNPYGTVPGANLGIAAERRRGRALLSADIGFYTVLSDFGVGDFVIPVFVPLMLGISW